MTDIHSIAHRKNLGYNRAAPDKNGVGLGSPLEFAAQAATEMDAAFFMAPVMAVLMGGAQAPAGFAPRVPRSSYLSALPPNWEVGRQGFNGTLEANMASTINSAIAPVLTVVDGTPTTTSHEVARNFGKQHNEVVKRIRSLAQEVGSMGIGFFTETPYTDPQNGQTYPAYRLTRDGFTLLAMGFTGKKALAFKLAYIKAFNDMEASLNSQQRITTEAPYSVLPGQKLSAENAAELRIMVQKAAERLPKEKQGGFCIKAWSKLKSHFGVGYRDIPESQFSDAVSILGRHIIECVGTTAGPEGSWLLQLDSDGRKTMTQLGWDDCIVKWDDLPKLIAATDNMLAPQLVADIAAAATSRMAQTLRLH
jgi:Rha family phage regulatory protein